MIGSVTFKAGAAQHVLRLSTGAMVRLERENGKSIHELMERLQDGVSVGFLAGMFQQMMNDGGGATEDEAFDLIDQLGGPLKAVEQISAAVEAAFPQPEDGADGAGDGAKKGNAKPARRG